MISRNLDEKLAAWKTAIEGRNIWQKDYGKKLEIAEFLFKVTEDSTMRYATRTVEEGGSVDLFEECFKQNPDRAGRPKDATTTILWRDLEQLRRQKEQKESEIDECAEEFINEFKQSDLQNHLCEEHQTELPYILSKYLFIFHFSPTGLSYLKLFFTNIDDTHIKSLKKFAEDFSQKPIDDKPTNKEQIIIAALLTFIIDKLRKYAQTNRVTAQSALRHVRGDLDHFSEKFGAHGGNLTSTILEDAEVIKRRLRRINPNYTRFQIDDVIDQVNSTASTLSEIYEIDSIGNVTTTISFLLAAAKISDSMGSDLNDNIAFTKECLSVTSAIAAREAYASNIAISATGKALGLLGAMLGVMTGIINAIEQARAGNKFLANLEAISTMAVFIGAFAGLINAGVAAGLVEASAFTAACGPAAIICAVVILIVAVIVWLFSDDPFVTYLKKTHWGINPQYRWQNTVEEFFKLIPFNVEVPSQSLGQQLWITSPVLDDTSPIFIKLNKDNRMLDSWKIIYPYRNRYQSERNNVQKRHWDEETERRLIILDLNSIWPGYPARGNFVFFVGMDPTLRMARLSLDQMDIKGNALYSYS